MENRNSDAAGIDVGFSAAVRNFHAFAEEVGRVSRISFEQNAELIDALGAARDVGDIVAIQTKFMTGVFEAFNEQFKLMMSHMAEFPAGFVAPAPAAPSVAGGEGAAATQASNAAASVTEPMPESEPMRPQSDSQPAPAGEKESTELAQQKSSSDPWQELAKIAAELKRAEAQVQKDVPAGRGPDATQGAGTGTRRARPARE